MRADHWIHNEQPQDTEENSSMFELRGDRVYGGYTNRIGSHVSFIADNTEFKRLLTERMQRAIRRTTNNGTILDFDPDAMIQSLMIEFVGYTARLDVKRS